MVASTHLFTRLFLEYVVLCGYFTFLCRMSLLTSLPRLFTLSSKNWCPKCNTIKPLDKFAHGRNYVNSVCNTCRGLPDPEEFADLESDKANFAYLKTLHAALPTSYSSRKGKLTILRRNLLTIYNNVCQGCRRTDEYIAYPYEDAYCTKPLSLFAANSNIKKAHFYCDVCAAKLPNKKPRANAVQHDDYGREVARTLDAFERLTTGNEHDKIRLSLPTLTEDEPERRKCNQCKQERLASDFVTKKQMAAGKFTYYLKDVCHSCRKQNAAEYARNKRKYIPVTNDTDDKRIRHEIEMDLKKNPCFECGEFHSEEKPLFYYDNHTLELQSSLERPYASLANIRLHKSCRKELIKIRSL